MTAAAAVLCDGKKADSDDSKKGTEHGLSFRQCAGQDSCKKGDHDNGHVFDQGTDTGIDVPEAERFKNHTKGIQGTQNDAAAKAVSVALCQLFMKDNVQNEKCQQESDSQYAGGRQTLQQCLGEQKRCPAGNENGDQ